MKKFMTILSAAVILAGSLFMTSCKNDGSDDSVLSPDTWFEYNYKKGEDTVSIYFMYSKNDYSTTEMRKDLTGVNADGSLPAGLTIVLHNDSSSEIWGIANSQIMVKTFKPGDSTAGSKVINDTTWNATVAYMMLSNRDLFNTGSTTVPDVMKDKNKNTFKQLSAENLKNMTWREILAEILLG